MFTGIIEEVGSVKEVKPVGKEARIVLSSSHIWRELTIGESVCVNGVCLTVVVKGEGTFTADISEESIERSTLGGIKTGAVVNLERALTLASRLGGHLVQGHVDGVGRLNGIKNSGEGRIYTFSCPDELHIYLVEKGSIAVDGISLTISTLRGGEFNIAAIPHTVMQTSLRSLKVGDPVNLEVDIIAKYVRSYLDRGSSTKEGAVEGDESLYRKLVEGGFA
jgi:riboflavin synthase